jgi:ribulose-bisphosphate carboxylase small chain
MRITQGTFSFLPDLTDGEIEAQLAYAVRNGWAIAVEYTDDPHPRNSYWEMWSLPMFDLTEDRVDEAMRMVRECREELPRHYVKVIAYDARHGRQTTALAFIVGRPPEEPGFRLDRSDRRDRQIGYRLQPYATRRAPVGRRYGADGASAATQETRDGGAGLRPQP